MKTLFRAASIVAFAAAPALCQETLRLDVTRASTPADPVVEIVIWAVFDPAHYAFNAAFFEMEATSGTFQNTECIPIQPGLCWDPGPWHSGSIVGGITVGQYHLPAIGFFAVLDNPIPVARTEWRPDMPGADEVEVITRTSLFRVYVDESGAPESRLATFTEGAVIIRVRQCYADCDGTDEVDLFDFLCFQDAFASGDFYADCDASGVLDIFDFLCFQNEFVAGCP